MLIGRANQDVVPLPLRQGIIEIIGTIMAYRFTTLSRREIDAMLGIKFEETRVYQEAKEEKAQEIALKMLRKDLDLDTIAEFTGLSIVQLQEMQAELK
jgi:predicted transposase YdaD